MTQLIVSGTKGVCCLLMALLAVPLAAGSGSIEPLVKTQDQPFVVVLGIAQDAGFPQIGCRKSCCKDAWKHARHRKMVASLAVVDPLTHQRWLFDATPDLKDQLQLLDGIHPVEKSPGLDGIFLTHGHMGHYTGLLQLGREAMGSKQVTVFAMPRMVDFLKNNGPWSQLVGLKNTVLSPLEDGRPVVLNERISVTPFTVPHRDEFTETVGYHIRGPNHALIFIPDIDKWERWSASIEDHIAKVDLAFIDGTFFADGEIPGRNMAQIPHPFIEESMSRFANLESREKQKIRFIHFNHTNPVLDPSSRAAKKVAALGFHLATQGERHPL